MDVIWSASVEGSGKFLVTVDVRGPVNGETQPNALQPGGSALGGWISLVCGCDDTSEFYESD
ncbi:hypothetical protein NG798_27285 [Ancylothrix sp. C2]|nr:hypothetical protein [Ancylothrix sp. D3o]